MWIQNTMETVQGTAEEKEKYAYWLFGIKGCTPRVQRQLFAVCRSAEEVYRLSSSALEKIPGLMHKDILRIIESRKTWDIDSEWYSLARSGICFVSMEQEAYPQQLRELLDAPYGIFYRGRLPAPGEFRVAVVGARMCSEYGRTIARDIARELALRDVPVVSGMARGIDAAGHRGALDSGGDTYAVFGCGVDVCYPNYHRQLYYEIEQHGGLLSEYLPGTKPLAAYFPQRNRLISVLSDVVLIIEAKERSGSLITADFALEQGRDVYALPGRITDALSRGCNQLIAQGAGIIFSVEDCLAELALQAVRKKEIVKNTGSRQMDDTTGVKAAGAERTEHFQEKIKLSERSVKPDSAEKSREQKSGFQSGFTEKTETSESSPKVGGGEKFETLHKFSLEKDEQLVYGCLGLLPTGMEELLERTGLDISAISLILAALLQKNRIEEVFKNHYRIITE